MSEKELNKVTKKEGEKLLKFGGGETLKSVMSCQLPCRLADTDVLIEVDAVESAIPLLSSLKYLKTAKAKLNLERDTAMLFGKEAPLNFTSSGHYCTPIGRKEGVEVEEVYQIKLSELPSQERGKTIFKLYRQFAHPLMIRLKALMQDAGVCNDEYQEELDSIHNTCQTCKLYAKTPARPVVSTPLAISFKEKVVMDLKSLEGKYINAPSYRYVYST